MLVMTRLKIRVVSAGKGPRVRLPEVTREAEKATCWTERERWKNILKYEVMFMSSDYLCNVSRLWVSAGYDMMRPCTMVNYLDQVLHNYV